ncbi:MAG: polysaccharide deacetylase family protein [Thermoleophilia bacterium]|nr:polysaccharide deacetylase family protein [Thermoleophilia bacterium]
MRAVDLVTGKLDVPAGKSPVVMTFDDSTKEQLSWDAERRAKPDTAIAIMLEFAREHEGYEPAGTFYVNREPFAGAAEGAAMLRWLHENGFELGNHTYDHIPFNRLGPAEVQRELVLGQKVILDAVPGARVETLALPLGAVPRPASLARRGAWRGTTYRHAGVFLVGAQPSPSPFAASFRPAQIPRIRTSPPGAPNGDYGSTYWLDFLTANPARRYVSDGDPERVSFPRSLASQLAPRFRERANAY